MADEIVENDFNHAQMEIDDDWESSYGRLDFNIVKFPDPKAMVDELTAKGFRTTLWVHPFTDVSSEYAWYGGLLHHAMRDPGNVPSALTQW